MSDKTKLHLVAVIALAMLLAACTASTPVATPAAARAAMLPVIAVGAGQLPEYWWIPDGPELAAPTGRSPQLGCVAVTFGIDVEGRVIEPKVRKSWPQGRFVDYALAAAPRWQFEPAVGNPVRQPVRSERVLVLQSLEGEIRPVQAEHVARNCR